MCGIAGWLSWENRLDPVVFGQMVSLLSHRGPDYQNTLSRESVMLGHTRLSIIDTSAASHQPMSDHSQRYHIVYNGELYNYRQLREELRSAGAMFATQSDTEVVLEAYKRWGESCLERFNGMFAFAIWDEAAGVLWMARDRMGEKPLFYMETQGGIVFASELPALLVHPACKKEMDVSRMGAYLTLGYDAGDGCLVHNVRRLPPATAATLTRQAGMQIKSYWDLAAHFLNKRSFASSTEAGRQLNELIDDSVKLRLVSDVPLGAFLSGGIDSSAIVASMAQSLPAGQIETFTMGFGEESFDETEYARMMADHVGVKGHFSQYAPTAPDIQVALQWAARDPLADTSFIPTFALSQYTRRHVTVALSGDGGDECLGGYDTYVADKLRAHLQHLPGWFFGAAAKGAGLLPVTFNKVALDFKARQFARGMAMNPRRAHCAWRYLFSAEELDQLVEPDWREQIRQHDPFQAFEPHFEAVKDAHFLDQAMYVDMKTWLANDILVKIDRASMAHGLESRAPFLDHRLVEFCASLPVHYKVNGFTRKAILKRSQKSLIPHPILHRVKRGFNAPVSHWLCGILKDYAYSHLTHACLRPFIRPHYVEQLWAAHQSKTQDNGFRLLSLLCFSLWLQRLNDPRAA